MDKTLLGFLALTGIIIGLLTITQFSESSIPPTPAIRMINTTSGNVSATSYNGFIEFIAGSGITITPNHSTNEITFSSSSDGVGENNTSSSSGLGESIILPKSGVDLPFKGIAVSGDLTIGSNGSDITIGHTGGASGEANTQSSPTHANSLVLTKSGVDLPIKGIACGGSILCTSNSTDITLTYSATGGGNVTNLNDAGDVVLTSPAQLSTLYFVGSQWIDKIFSINSVTGSAGNLLYSISNQTGMVGTATIKNKLLDGSNHTDTVAQDPSRGSLIVGSQLNKWDELVIGANGSFLFSTGADPSWKTVKNKLLDGNNHTDTVSQDPSRGSIIYGDSTPKWNELTIGTNGKVLTSDGTDISWQTPTGSTARESLVASWENDRTWTNIGVTYVDVYTVANSNGEGMRIDTAGKTTVTLNIMWTKVGVGNNKCQIVDITSPTNILIIGTNLVTGQNTNATVTIPAGLANTIKTYKPQCLSTTSTDDPSWLHGQVLLK